MHGIALSDLGRKEEEPTTLQPVDIVVKLPTTNVDDSLDIAHKLVIAVGAIASLFYLITIGNKALITFTYNGASCAMGFLKFCVDGDCHSICPSETDSGWKATYTFLCLALIFSLWVLGMSLFNCKRGEVVFHNELTLGCVLSSVCALLAVICVSVSEFVDESFANFSDTAYQTAWGFLLVGGLITFIMAAVMVCKKPAKPNRTSHHLIVLFFCALSGMALWCATFGFGDCGPTTNDETGSSSSSVITWHTLFDPILDRLANNGESSCPAYSNGASVETGCDCNAGYIGSITSTVEVPFFTGECLAISCPEHSQGTIVAAGCTCDDGYEGSIVASTYNPFYTGNCDALSCGALTVANSDMADGSTTGVFGDLVTVTCDNVNATTFEVSCDYTAPTASWTIGQSC